MLCFVEYWERKYEPVECRLFQEVHATFQSVVDESECNEMLLPHSLGNLNT